MMADLLYLDDLAIGRCFGSATMIVDESEMTSYAQLFDPQPFHLDREAARERHNQALTQQEATAILARYQELWNRAALAELLDGFTDDIITLRTRRAYPSGWWSSPICRQSRESASWIGLFRPGSPGRSTTVSRRHSDLFPATRS